MPHGPARIFLDTNVYIIGAAYPESQEAQILRWVGFGQNEPGPVEVVVSEELFEQIDQYPKRLILQLDPQPMLPQLPSLRVHFKDAEANDAPLIVRSLHYASPNTAVLPR